MTVSQIREHRQSMRVSQAELARRARLSRYRLHLGEMGGQLSTEEIERLHSALREYAKQMRERFSAAGM